MLTATAEYRNPTSVVTNAAYALRRAMPDLTRGVGAITFGDIS